MIGSGLFWQTLQKDIKKHRDHVLELMSQGNCDGFHGYHNAVGQVSAINWVLQRAKEILGEDDRKRNPVEEEIDD